MWKSSAVLLLSLCAGVAHAGTACDDVKAQIEAKIKAKGVSSYTLEAVPSEEVKDQKVVGTCEGGAKKIVYKRS